MDQSFYSFDLRQPVNQWLCIALISFTCLLVVIYFLVNRTEAFGNDYTASILSADYSSSNALNSSIRAAK